MRVKDKKDGKEGYITVRRSHNGKPLKLSDPEYAKKHCPFLMSKSEMEKKISQEKAKQEKIKKESEKKK